MLKTKIIFHLGTFKTGSSSIQNTLWANRKLLRKQGILYPKTGLKKSEAETGIRHSPLAYKHKSDIKQW